MRAPLRRASALLAAVAWLGCGGSDRPPPSPSAEVAALSEAYVARWLETFPHRATAAGHHAYDDRVPRPWGATLERWIAENRRMAAAARRLLDQGGLEFADRHDLELLLRQAELELFELEVQEVHRTNPLFWSGVLSATHTHLLVREDLPLDQRLASVAARVAALPEVAAQARATLEATPVDRIAPELCEIAARQLRATARFFREGLAGAAGDDTQRELLAGAGAQAAAALDELAAFVEEMATRATGSPRLGERYAERLRLVTGFEDGPDALLQRGEAALAAKRAEVAAFGREIWSRYLDGEPPADHAEVARRLFRRAADDHAASVEEFVADYVSLLHEAERFVEEHDVVTLPGELTVRTDRSPEYFLGQSVGGVYPAGPFAPDSDTLFYLPTPPRSADDAQREAFFRDFNHHFNVMITPHEMIPGHYLQLKVAAHHPRQVRALFGDGVFTEGWGTFCERLMLDLGWGDDLARAAHLKKQMENIARTIVDVRVHTRGMTHDEVIEFVHDEALQEAQFASNMWTRAITSTPQITSYWLGYELVSRLFQDVRAARGDAFVLRDFMDGVVSSGSLPVRAHREVLLGEGGGVESGL
ncbi:MAG TPA: DUF885 domain-containing protein [Thermoanaerobaculia bacterium]|nr:DUF885 domain-containing protein [Thermoanaerobaculia bacterium]